jgi:hypothetical protein
MVALLFLFFHKRLCGPLADSHFHHQPDAKHRPHSQLSAAYHRADKAINQIFGLLAYLPIGSSDPNLPRASEFCTEDVGGSAICRCDCKGQLEIGT